ncbi:MAG: glycoside hydrolase family 16 protein [Verrucomicrobiae bacterium]|nr:glycoside hydrolase family 16 protein [Verrucomicrobiae bacterium]
MKLIKGPLQLLGLGLLLAASGFAQELPGWKLIWADEFDQPNGTRPDTNRWVFDLGHSGWGNAELQNYTARTNNVRIENGQLIIEAHPDNFQDVRYSSGRIKTQGKFSFTYGRAEARIKIPRGQGIWPAFWMLGDRITTHGWPACGEIDIMENIGREPKLIHGTIHGPGYSGNGSIGGVSALPDHGNFADDFHVYAIEWTPDQIRWFMDGTAYFQATPKLLPEGATWAFTQPHFLLLNLAVGGHWPGYPDNDTVLPQRLVVDYVRVYQSTTPTSISGSPENEKP